jgi:hypothetical protein
MSDGKYNRNQGREAAFDLYCSGLPLREVHRELVGRCGGEAPSLSTLKRWSTDGDWVARRDKIQDAREEQHDQQRILYGMDYIAELTRIRRKLLSDAAQLKVNSGDQAIYALIALEKLLDKLVRYEECAQRRKQREPGYTGLLEQLDHPPENPAPLPPNDWSALIVEALKQESLQNDAETQPK